MKTFFPNSEEGANLWTPFALSPLDSSKVEQYRVVKCLASFINKMRRQRSTRNKNKKKEKKCAIFPDRARV
jgi:hypothetical protein